MDEQKKTTVIIGDSIFALNGEIARQLCDYSGYCVADYAISGSQMRGTLKKYGGSAADIPAQYRQARAQHANIHTIIFNGGANDITLGAMSQCREEMLVNPDAYIPYVTASTQIILEELEQLLTTMKNDGVTRMIYVSYYETQIERHRRIGTPVIENILSFLKEQQSCVNAPQWLSYIDPRPIFIQNESYIDSRDGMHPSIAGSRVLAQLIWQEMQKYPW